MANIWDKFKEALIGADLYDEDDYEEYEEIEDVRPPRPTMPTTPLSTRENREPRPRGTNGDWHVLRSDTEVSRPVTVKQSRTQVKLVFPSSIEDSRPVVGYVKDEIITIVNLFGMELEQAQRIADFVAGAVDALGGDILRLSNDMFLIAPSSVDIMDPRVKEDIHVKTGFDVSSISFGGFGKS